MASKSVVGTPFNLGLILEHIKKLTEVQKSINHRSRPTWNTGIKVSQNRRGINSIKLIFSKEEL